MESLGTLKWKIHQTDLMSKTPQNEMNNKPQVFKHEFRRVNGKPFFLTSECLDFYVVAL